MMHKATPPIRPSSGEIIMAELSHLLDVMAALPMVSLLVL
jgi:hypothetical protein